MNGVNKFHGIGNLGADPELRYTASGDAVCSFSIAVPGGYKENDKPTWIRVTTWRKVAENCKEYLERGSKVYVSGMIKLNTYETKDGGKGASLELTAQNVQFLSSMKSDDTPKEEPKDDDLPF